jgi:putative heme-binding domain-containing protein
MIMRTLSLRCLKLFAFAASLSAYFLACSLGPLAASAADDSAKKKDDKLAKVIPPAGPLKTLKGFEVELLYTVPKEQEGSWVNMTTDPKGRLIVSDQYGALYRVTPQPIGDKTGECKVEPIDIPLGEAHGLLWAFNSLYVVVNKGKQYESGLYRVKDTNDDDRFDSVELLRKIQGGGEHGPHAVILSPDGKSLYLVAGNATRAPETNKSVMKKIWGEDNLLPRMVDGSGFMADERAPGGFICRLSPDGKDCELIAMGFRNPFDIAFNPDGELFTYDSDMEWDVNTPWYRPTRVVHVTSGGDYGYRNGAGKWPPYYIDSLPAVADVGPGSPTGMVFGGGAKFPAKYQLALFCCDWSYGKLYALHLKPQGATYGGELEEFVSGTPLALTDVVINPQDGAMYFLVGGRKTQSGLYRVTYSGEDSTAPAKPAVDNIAKEARDLRHKAEALQGKSDSESLDVLFPLLSHSDRFIRFAARVGIEYRDPAAWSQRALKPGANAEGALQAILALIQTTAQDPAHRGENYKDPIPAECEQVYAALAKIDFAKLSLAEQLDLLRVYEVALCRFPRPNDKTISQLIERFNPLYPAKIRELNIELVQLLTFLQAPETAAKTVALLQQAPTQEEQIEYGRALRVLKSGWTPALSKSYFEWIGKADGYKGGNSFRGFMRNIRRDAVANLSDSDKTALGELVEAKPDAAAAPAGPPRPVVKEYALPELTKLVEPALAGRDFERGRALFAVAKCFSCHRFNNEGGGLGPDLSGLAGRFNKKDLLESIVEPSKVISDQYEAITIVTNDGRVITGRIANLSGDDIQLNSDMLNPNNMAHVKRQDIEELTKSKISMMPEGLLNTLNENEVLDLMAYLLSRGDRQNSMFKAAK